MKFSANNKIILAHEQAILGIIIALSTTLSFAIGLFVLLWIIKRLS